MFGRWGAKRWPEAAPEEVAFFKTFFEPGDLAFDVGANHGNKTHALRLAGARVVAFEPQADCLSDLRKRFGKDPDVQIAAVGLASEPGSLQLSICSSEDTISTFSDDWKLGRFADDYTWDSTVTVPVMTLDDAIEEWGKPAFIKVDVERLRA